MNANLQSAVPEAANQGPSIPEKDHLRECSTAGASENERIVEVAFTPSTTRFRECCSNPPRKLRNAERRSREFLTPAEVETLINAAEKLGRHGHRDATMVLIAYRHALRVSELISLRWDQIDLAQGFLHVRRRFVSLKKSGLCIFNGVGVVLPTSTGGFVQKQCPATACLARCVERPNSENRDHNRAISPEHSSLPEWSGWRRGREQRSRSRSGCDGRRREPSKLEAEP